MNIVAPAEYSHLFLSVSHFRVDGEKYSEMYPDFFVHNRGFCNVAGENKLERAMSFMDNVDFLLADPQ